MEFLAFFWDVIVHLDKHLAVLLGQYGTWVYAILFAIIFCETGLVVTPFLPGDSLLFVAGALWAASDMNINALALTIIVAAFCGDNVNYFIGRKLGPKVFKSEGSRFLNRSALDKTQAFYVRHGGKTVIMARFVPLVRTFAPFVAGIGKMFYPRYILFSVVGSLLWVGLLAYGGYFFGNLPIVKSNLSIVIGIIIVISVAPIAIEYVRAKARA
ncbi:MAG: DedA family protein [Burkholderiales bacterium]